MQNNYINYRNFKNIDRIIFSEGAIKELSPLLKCKKKSNDYNVFIIDHFFKDHEILKKIENEDNDFLYFVDTSFEPTTESIDLIVRIVKTTYSYQLPSAVIGIGGGSTLDTAKAVSILLTNEGSSEDYQGWNLVLNPPIYKIGIPTLSGTGSEVSRTTVLKGPHKKQGINSDFSTFDQIILDPLLTKSAPPLVKFYTAMDCFIHSAEALSGNFLNAFSKAYAEKALEICTNYFLGSATDADLMIASMMGGHSIVYSEVGVCHALSYGLSYAYGTHHGEANCIVFDHLDDYYPEYVNIFRKMLIKHNIVLKKNVTKNISPQILEKMIDITLLMEKPLQNALGENWKSIFTREKIKEMYLKI